MEKTILIDGKEVNFKSTGATPLRYKTQFNEDFFKAITKMQALANVKGGITLKHIELIDFDTFYNIAWTMAKTADPTIPDPITWLDSFETFPILDIISELAEMIISTIDGKKK